MSSEDFTPLAERGRNNKCTSTCQITENGGTADGRLRLMICWFTAGHDGKHSYFNGPGFPEFEWPQLEES